MALPLIYRHFGETKIGINIENGPSYAMNECTWLLILPAAFVLGVYSAVQIFRGRWSNFAVPAAATLVIFSGPGIAAADGVRVLPIGLLAIIGSFALFGCGTAAALTKHLWHRNGSSLAPVPAKTQGASTDSASQ